MKLASLTLAFLFLVLGCKNSILDSEITTDQESVKSKSMPSCSVPGWVLNATQAYCFDDPELNYPANDVFQEASVNFSWNSVDGPSIKRYTLQIDDNSNFSSPEYSYTISGTSKTVNSITRNIEYYWRVIVDATDPNEPNFGYTYYQEGYSNTRSFKVRPEKPNFVSGSIENGKPKLSWNRNLFLTSKIIRTSFNPSIIDSEFYYGVNPFDNNYGNQDFVDSGLTEDFVTTNSIFNSVQYHIININGQGWESLSSNFNSFEPENSGGGGF
ncbi:MAG: hypothetical protein JXR11_04935 [Balneola sp.]